MPDTYIRWRNNKPRKGDVMPPLILGHPFFVLPCPNCDEVLGDGRPVQLLALGPTNARDLANFHAGRWIKAAALLAHAECLGTDLKGAAR